jgi:signal peptidase II
MNLSKVGKVSLIILGSFLLLIVESLIKYYWILNKIPQGGFYLFGKIIQIIFIPNYYIAFNLPLPQYVIILAVLIILTMLGYYWWLNLLKLNFFNVLAISLVITGALSNLIDRLIFGFVIDYINLIFWPVFNLADVVIVLGVIIYFLNEFRQKPQLTIYKIKSED